MIEYLCKKPLSTLALSIILLFHTYDGKAQDVQQHFRQMQDSMLLTIDSMYESPIPEWRMKHSQKFIRQLVSTLKNEHSYSFRFDSLAKVINVIYSPDNSFRIFNWNVAQNDVAVRYFGAIQINNKDLQLFPLIDISQEVSKGLDDSVFHGPRWYGGIIYNIMDKEVDGKKIYFLFTKNDGGTLSTIKLIEPMLLTPKGPIFGMPAFAIASQSSRGQRAKRFVLEYKKDVQAGLNWSTDLNAVVFDRLASVANDPNRKYTYAPTGQYDALKWENNSWQYVQDVMPFTELIDGQEPVGGVDMPK